jgi:hypothetical protein
MAENSLAGRAISHQQGCAKAPAAAPARRRKNHFAISKISFTNGKCADLPAAGSLTLWIRVCIVRAN